MLEDKLKSYATVLIFESLTALAYCAGSEDEELLLKEAELKVKIADDLVSILESCE